MALISSGNYLWETKTLINKEMCLVFVGAILNQLRFLGGEEKNYEWDNAIWTKWEWNDKKG